MSEVNEMKQWRLISILEDVRDTCTNQKDCRSCPYKIPRKDTLIDCLPAIVCGTMPLNLKIEEADRKLSEVGKQRNEEN